MARFQSTSLTRGTTSGKLPFLGTMAISIHVPHTRDDVTPYLFAASSTYFNPRPSHEGRRV